MEFINYITSDVKMCVIYRWKRMLFALVDFQLDAQNPYLFTYNTFMYVHKCIICK